MQRQPLRNLAQRVKTIRHERNLTQEQVADGAQLHVTYIAGIEGGKRNPTYLALLALAKGLGVKPEELFKP